jgi:hypothetical protein
MFCIAFFACPFDEGVTNGISYTEVHSSPQNPLIVALLRRNRWHSPFFCTQSRCNHKLWGIVCWHFFVRLLFLRGLDFLQLLELAHVRAMAWTSVAALRSLVPEMKSSNCPSELLWGWWLKIFEGALSRRSVLSGKCFLVITGLRYPIYLRCVFASMP